MDITQLIVDDHEQQRGLFAILEQIEPTNITALAAVWDRLATFLQVHAEAEEQLFYPELLRVGQGVDSLDPAAETRHAIDDHNDIRSAITAVADHQVGSAGWYDAVANANEANSNHMAEEEREGLTDFRRHAGLQLRHDLAIAFAVFKATHVTGVSKSVDKDPELYVREMERKATTTNDPGTDNVTTPDGSLCIDNLNGH
jgi:Hemerythrin HHE cation binding domain